MAKRLLLLVSAVLAAVPALAQQDERTLTPYFDFDVSEAVFAPTHQDTFFSGGNMLTSVGLLANLDHVSWFPGLPGSNALFGLYNFNYEGPGFQPQDYGEFQYQSMTHSVSLEYRWKLRGPWRIRPGFGYSTSYVRSDAGEVWGQGLYDNQALGGQLAIDYIYSDGVLTAQALYRHLHYPNFTDLLREFENAGLQAQISGGLEDQGMQEYSLSGSYKKLNAGVKYILENFDNQTVVESNGVYGSTLQHDYEYDGWIGLNAKVGRIETQPQFSVAKHSSNQNFLLFRFFGDPAPSFMPDWYSYTEYRATLPVYLNLTQDGTALMASAALIQRNYDERQARDPNDQFTIGEVQKNTMWTFNGGIRFRINEVSYMRVLAGIVVARSNNTFETYLPYNYTGFTGGIGFTLAY